MPSGKLNSGQPQDIISKARKYCAYRERCHEEVRSKLYSWGVNGALVEETIARLITEGFVNEERFAQLYAGGKFRQNKWGRVKILAALKKRNISAYCIKKGLEEIEEEEYLKTLINLIERKSLELKEKRTFVKKEKIAAYCIQKGYETELVWKLCRDYTDCT